MPSPGNTAIRWLVNALPPVSRRPPDRLSLERGAPTVNGASDRGAGRFRLRKAASRAGLTRGVGLPLTHDLPIVDRGRPGPVAPSPGGSACLRHLNPRVSRSPTAASWSRSSRPAASPRPTGGSAPSTRSSATPTATCGRSPTRASAACGRCWRASRRGSTGAPSASRIARSPCRRAGPASRSSLAASSSSRARRSRPCTRPARRCTSISTRCARSPSRSASACSASASSPNGGATTFPGCPRAAIASCATTCPRRASSAST